MAEERSYSALVFRRAWRNTWTLLKNTTTDALVGIPSLLIGAAIFLMVYGRSEMTKEIVKFIAFVLAPAGLFLVFFFLWNLYLASDELIYEAIKNMPKPPSEAPLPAPAKPTYKPVNWAIWKQRSKYAVREFAAILAKDDPASLSVTHEQSSFRALILEAIGEKKLKYIPSYYQSFDGRRENDIDADTELSKSNAIAWAESCGFSVDHVK